MTDSNKGLRILIIEDNPGDQYLITELLQATVIKIQLLNTAETLGNAIDILQKEIFDIILLDLSLPDSSGINTFKAIKKVAGKMPVVILSGLTDMNIAVEAITLGAQDYHIKGDLDEKTLTQTILYSIERKRRLEDLRENGERYITISKADLDLMQSGEITRQIMNAALDAIICTDTYGKIIFWNPQAEKIFGWKQQEILGRTITETIIPVEFREKHEKAISHYLATGEGVTLNKLIEVTAVNREGHHFPAELTTIPLTENGNLFFCAFIRDISERKKAENAQRESEETFRRLFNESADSVLLLDDTGFTDCNQSAVSIFGYSSKQEVLNKKPWDISPEKQPDGRLSTEKAEAMIAKALQQGYNRFEWVHIKSDGTEFPVEVMLTSIILKGKQSFYALLRDITERKKAELALKKSEEKYRTLFEQSPAGIYQTTLKGKIITCNDAFAIMLGYSSFAELPEKNSSWFYFSDAERDTSIAELQEKGELINHEIVLKHKDGNTVYLIENCFLRKDTITGEDIIEGMMIDITERKKSAIALKESEEKYRSLIEQASDGIVVYSLDGTIYEFNQAACLMGGYSKEEFKKINLQNLLDSEDVIINPSNVERFRKGETVLFERRVRKKDGTVIDIEQNVRMIPDGKLIAITRDITGRKKMEEALIKSELYLRGTLDSTNDGILAIDNNGKVITTNNRFAELWHIPEELISQKDDRKLLEYVLGQLIDPEAFLSKVRDLYNSDRTDFDILQFKDGRVFERYSTPLILNQDIVGRVWSFRDITEQKKADATLKASEQNLRQVLSSTEDYFYVIDRNCRITLINESAEKSLTVLWGKPVGVGINIFDVIPPERNEFIKNNLEQVFTGKKIEYELHNTFEGLSEWLHVNYMPVNDGSGTIIGAYIVTKDITERKKAEEKLKDSEERYRSLVEQASDGILVTDLQGTILEVNSMLCTMFGYRREEVIQKNVTSFLDPKNIEMQPLRLNLLQGEQSLLLERQAIHKNGTLFDIELNTKLFGEGKALSIIRDITERKKAEQALKESEEKLLASIENTPNVAVQWYNKLGEVQFWNRASENIFGWKSSEAIGKTLDKLIHTPEATAEFFEALKQVEKTGQAIGPAEFTFSRRDGSEGSCVSTLFSIPSGTGEPCFVCMDIDITERKKTEQALKESEEKYRTLIEQASDPILIYSLDGKMIDYNNALMSATGYQKEDIENLKLTDFLFEEDLKKKPLHFSRIKNGIAVHDERRIKRKDGSATYIELNSKMMPDGNIMVIARDISDRKKAEEQILKTNARFQMLSKATSDIVWDWDLLDGSLWWNDNYYSLLGIKKEKEITEINDWYKRIHPDDLKRVREKIEKAIRGNATFWSDEYRFAKADGTYLHFLDRGYIMRNVDGQPYRMIGSMVDMTPVYIAQKEVAESENRLRTIYETEPECIKLLGPEGELLEMNPAGLAMIEADNLEMVKGKSVLGIVAPAYRKAFDKLTRDVYKGKSGTLEFEVIGLKGTHRWLETHAVPMRDAAGHIIALLGVTRNITERKKAEQAVKESEEKYRTLVEQAVDAIALYDVTGKILDVNTGSVNLLGYSKEELMQMSLSDVLTAEEIKSKPVQYDVLQKGNSTVKQRKMKRKDKSIVETEVRSQQLPDGRFLSVIRDLTDRQKAEQELEDSYAAIRRLTDHLQNIREEERAHIAREIHDELGQQLTVMKMDISWINKKLGVKDESVNTRIKELLSMIDETVKSVRRISSELRPSLLDDLGLTAAMEWQLSEFEKRFGIKAHFKFEDAEMKLPETIKTGLFRIFQESLTNVARHSRTKKVAVTLTRENSSIVLSIADDGVGFDKQKAAAKKTLGILGMKERTAMIGGTYEIISSPGKGTRVVVKIPLGDSNKN